MAQSRCVVSCSRGAVHREALLGADRSILAVCGLSALSRCSTAAAVLRLDGIRLDSDRADFPRKNSECIQGDLDMEFSDSIRQGFVVSSIEALLICVISKLLMVERNRR